MNDFSKRSWSELVVRSICSTSRTMSGVYDRSSSAHKPSRTIENGRKLALVSRERVREAACYLWEMVEVEYDVSSQANISNLILTTAKIVNHGGEDGIIPKKEFRTWETKFPFQVKPNQINWEYDRFCKWFARSVGNLDAVVLAAEVERELNWRIHPFADGCGRTSKLLASYVLLRGNVPPASYTDSENYYAAMNGWLDFYRDMVDAAVV